MLYSHLVTAIGFYLPQMICCLGWVLNQQSCYASSKLFIQVLPLVTHSLQLQALDFELFYDLCLNGHWSSDKFP